MAEAQAQIFPPPRLTGDPASDAVALNLWTHQFYEAVIIQGGLATPGTVESAVDPANATAATAQNTANDALALAQQLDAGLECGSFNIADAATTALVTFASAQPDTNYEITFGPQAIAGAPAIDASIVRSYAKTTTDFTVTIAAAPGAGTSVTISWQLQRNN